MTIDTFLGPEAQEYADLLNRIAQYHWEYEEHKRRKEGELVRGILYTPFGGGGLVACANAVKREYEHATMHFSPEIKAWADSYAVGVGALSLILLYQFARGITGLISWRRHAKAASDALRKKHAALAKMEDLGQTHA